MTRTYASKTMFALKKIKNRRQNIDIVLQQWWFQWRRWCCWWIGIFIGECCSEHFAQVRDHIICQYIWFQCSILQKIITIYYQILQIFFFDCILFGKINFLHENSRFVVRKKLANQKMNIKKTHTHEEETHAENKTNLWIIFNYRNSWLCLAFWHFLLLIGDWCKMWNLNEKKRKQTMQT